MVDSMEIRAGAGVGVGRRREKLDKDAEWRC